MSRLWAASVHYNRYIDKHKVIAYSDSSEQILQQQNDSNTAPLATTLRAGDPYARKLLSQQADVNHLLLRVVLPKRTGRKRKRGSNDPFEYHGDEATERDLPQASEVLDKLSIASNETSMDILGSIHCNHRFRSLPDFQVLDQDNHVMQRIAKQLLNPTRTCVNCSIADVTNHV